MNGSPSPKTIHLVVPATGRPLCGYEEDVSGSGEGASVPCPECSALLRSGLVPRGSTDARAAALKKGSVRED
jgi:hypothetical protein